MRLERGFAPPCFATTLNGHYLSENHAIVFHFVTLVSTNRRAKVTTRAIYRQVTLLYWPRPNDDSLIVARYCCRCKIILGRSLCVPTSFIIWILVCPFTKKLTMLCKRNANNYRTYIPIFLVTDRCLIDMWNGTAQLLTSAAHQCLDP